MRLSKKYAVRKAEAKAMSAHLIARGGGASANAVRLGVSAAEIAMLGDLRAAFDAAYAAYADPKTHNEISVQAMKAADAKLQSFVLPLRQRLKRGFAALTPKDYAALFIHQDKTTRTPRARPRGAPALVLAHCAPGKITFEATAKSGEAANRRAMPKHCKLAREMAVAARGTPPAKANWKGLALVGRARFTLTFSAREAGMNLHLRAAYENSAGRGPFSAPITAIII